MTITDSDLERACRLVMGNLLADSIISDLGLHWGVVAAIARAKTSDSPEGLRILREHLAEIKASKQGDVKPVRLQLSRHKGFSLQAHSRAVNGLPAMNVARPSKYGNPFVVLNEEGYPLIQDNRDGSSFGVSEAKRHEAGGAIWRAAALEAVSRFRSQCIDSLRLGPLRGKNLACWCALCEPHKSGKPFVVQCDDCSPCHADVLLELANPSPPSRLILSEGS